MLRVQAINKTHPENGQEQAEAADIISQLARYITLTSATGGLIAQ
jgi:hypothetical protein